MGDKHPFLHKHDEYNTLVSPSAASGSQLELVVDSKKWFSDVHVIEEPHWKGYSHEGLAHESEESCYFRPLPTPAAETATAPVPDPWAEAIKPTATKTTAEATAKATTTTAAPAAPSRVRILNILHILHTLRKSTG